ncbi:hypothetical protein CMI37_21830 [Candidatus Pacearchaeota archaeon]|nr:hypothetical protein [Candidatus Pacearchaeota archaeon]
MKPQTKIAIVMLILLVIPIISAAQDIGTIRRNDCITLPQVCENCTYNNISSVLAPVNRTLLLANVPMTKDDTYYNYSFCNTTELGGYIVNGFGDLDGTKTAWTYNFEVTGTGFEFTSSRSTYYIGLLAMLVFFFVITIFAIPKIPTGNNSDNYGMLMSINHLKHLKPVLMIVSWIILIGIIFTSSNIALAYLGSSMFGQLLFRMYQIMFSMTLPGIVVMFIFIFINIFRDREMKKMIERGVDIQTP